MNSNSYIHQLRNALDSLQACADSVMTFHGEGWKNSLRMDLERAISHAHELLKQPIPDGPNSEALELLQQQKPEEHSATPRTDALRAKQPTYVEMAEHAERLERDRARLVAELKRLQGVVGEEDFDLIEGFLRELGEL